MEDSLGRLSSFSASGHAGWAEQGSDIVLRRGLHAAASGVAGTSRGGRGTGERRAIQRACCAWLARGDRERADVAAIAATAARSIERLAVQFPEHVSAAMIRAEPLREGRFGAERK